MKGILGSCEWKRDAKLKICAKRLVVKTVVRKAMTKMIDSLFIFLPPLKYYYIDPRFEMTFSKIPINIIYAENIVKQFLV